MVVLAGAVLLPKAELAPLVEVLPPVELPVELPVSLRAGLGSPDRRDENPGKPEPGESHEWCAIAGNAQSADDGLPEFALPRQSLPPCLTGERAGSGNRTRMASLEDWNFTTKLYPRNLHDHACAGIVGKRVFAGGTAFLTSGECQFYDAELRGASEFDRVRSLPGPVCSGILAVPRVMVATCCAEIPDRAGWSGDGLGILEDHARDLRDDAGGVFDAASRHRHVVGGAEASVGARRRSGDEVEAPHLVPPKVAVPMEASALVAVVSL